MHGLGGGGSESNRVHGLVGGVNRVHRVQRSGGP